MTSALRTVRSWLGLTVAVCLLLAAGAARRYGRAKQIEPLADGTALVRHAALAALAVCEELRVVVGAHREAVIAALAGLPVTIIEHEDWAQGMGASIAWMRIVQATSDPLSSSHSRSCTPGAPLSSMYRLPLEGPTKISNSSAPTTTSVPFTS